MIVKSAVSILLHVYRCVCTRACVAQEKEAGPRREKKQATPLKNGQLMLHLQYTVEVPVRFVHLGDQFGDGRRRNVPRDC